MKTNTIMLIGVILCLVTSGFAIYYATQGEWHCVKINCSMYVTGDAWAARHCKTNENKTDMLCYFSIEGNNYVAPLSQINTSQFRSCVEEECETAIKIKQGGSIK